MTEHFGGPECPEKLRERQGRYGAGFELLEAWEFEFPKGTS
ncbi:MAG TPA: hypothetical protein VFH80_13810 [Solirubrobacteraceae bacterium]|nr:hypothetical protein [Solirubrobacteraceae bacterium]